MDLNYLLVKTNAIVLHEMGLTGKGIRVAILDSGIDQDHPLIQGNVIESYNLTDEEIGDECHHGTHIASILTSIAPDVEIINIKILEKKCMTQTSRIMKGIELAKNKKVDFINISVGDPEPDCPEDHPIADLINKCNEEGIIVVSAAGNSGPHRSPHIPASCKNSLAVGAVNKKGKTCKYSSRGAVCGEIYPDCVSWGDDIYAASPNEQMKSLSGTSQSCPQVTGMLVLIKQATGVIFYREDIEYLLSQSCKPLESNDKNNISGWGLIDMEKYLRATQLYLKEL